VIAAAAVCPSPPLLARELTGRADVLPELRAACATAVGRLLASGPDAVLVVGGGAATATWGAGDRLDLSAWAPGLRGRGTPGLPLGLGLGAMLLDEAGFTGQRILQAGGGPARRPGAHGRAGDGGRQRPAQPGRARSLR
jgi:hypothetical protein